MLKLIEDNQKHTIPQERYKYEMKRNLNAAIGVMKSYFVKTVTDTNKDQKRELLNQIEQLMVKHLIPIRKDRKFGSTMKLTKFLQKKSASKQAPS